MKLTTLLVLAALVGCSTPEGRERRAAIQHRQYLEEQANKITVDVSDGISEVEAYKIGRERFETYNTACSMSSMPVDTGDYWRVSTYVGVAATHAEDILIRKSDGSTTIQKAAVHSPQ